MTEPAPRLRGSVRARLRRFSWLMLGVVLLAIASLLVSQMWLERSSLRLQQHLLPHWQTAQRLNTDARALSAQAARLPLALGEGELDTLLMQVESRLSLLDEDLARLLAHTGETRDIASLRRAMAQLRATIERASAVTRQRIAEETTARDGGGDSAVALRRMERDLARLLDEQSVVLTSYASVLANDTEQLLQAQRDEFALKHWLQTLLILLAGLTIGTLLLAQSKLLERQLLQRIETLRHSMLSGTVDAQLLRGDGRGDELDAMQAELARLLGRLTEQNLALEQLATTDPLTGLANRRRLFEQLDHEAARHRRSLQPLSLLLIDIDHFKRVNDNWGHNAGDHVLQGLARLLVSGLRQVDLTARYGGEEFLVVLPDTGTEGALAAAELVRRRVAASQLPLSDDETLQLTVSIGVATLQDDESIPNLIDRADRALYQAKHQGRNQVCGDTLTAPRPA
ncbi:GGDEF domain-containing protein [Pseudomonas oryzae]|uniref:diguanylate cyclase n=1 Tax=Pseudomonas oryzae TaxID=1392877 RepID=A0A1H1YMR9_9PSED|nr:GGDEF domain-containing protein [Pseudomonas oryzae]SDT22767.1 diguanylate cyclase (GGDEF) domain-containing protein [Pseudomonas oryzae]